MPFFQNQIVILFLSILFIPCFVSAQGNAAAKWEFDVHRVYPYIYMSKEKLKTVNNLKDLNPHYKPSWVRTYIAVEVITLNQGKTRRAVSKNDILSQEQQRNMNTADAGSEISVNVQYIPENTLTNNEAKEINFSFMVDPEKDAKFVGGQQKLKLFLKENAIDKMAKENFSQYQLAAVKFTIDEDGRVIDPHLFWTSENKKTDELLLETVCNMPNWTPATYADGTSVKQEFVLTVGDMESCVVPLLNIRRAGQNPGFYRE